MAKFKISSNLLSDEGNLVINTNGIKNKNKIIYKENEISVTILIFDNKIEMKRVHPDYIIELNFDINKETYTNYQFIGGDKVFKLTTKTKKLIISDKKIEIEYVLEDNKFSYKLELEDLWKKY